MRDVALTTIESDLLTTIVRGIRPDFRNRHLIRLNHLRLIMVQGNVRFVPTALGFEWYRRHKEQKRGTSEEGCPQGAAKRE
ncbi:MAG: hypothetical protein IKE60_34635 [Reyranella sp.]|uniref:hypothetical protein n=1 Tax=Reyranella sp. TaxID=1929291 RepID=UPI0025F94970|nr:hypothetical protein [Reyranella sp.]MBR2819859.1 hypothetical protein [Reyranella sp.]